MPKTIVSKFAPVFPCLVFSLLVNDARAAFNYWDPTGLTGSATPNGNWEDNAWAQVAAGTATPGAFQEGILAVFTAGTNGASPFTVTANANHSTAGIFNGGIGGTTTCSNLLITGPGILSFTGNQGFSTGANGFTTITCVLGGTGSIQPEGGGQLFLNATNTFSGGLNMATGGALVNFNNPASFGTGTMTLSSSGGALISEGTTAFTVTNNWTATTTANENLVGNAAGITWSGNWNLGANTVSLGSGGSTTFQNILSGVISGSGGFGRQSQTTAGIIKLTGPNTYTGKTSIQSGTTSVSSLNSVSGGSPSSNLGAPTTVANGTISLGSTTIAGTLEYTGPGETSDRVIDMAGTTGGTLIESDGSGAVVFTSDCTASGAGAKTLTLEGSNTGVNTMAGKIANGSSTTSVTKAQAGTWQLSGANTYSGNTTLSAGLLDLANVSALGGGTLVMGGNGSFDNTSGADLTVANGITCSSGSPIYVGSANNMTFNGAAAISGANRTITVSAKTLTLGSAVGDSGQGRSLTKAGAGTLVLSGVNTYTGNTTISAGTLALGSSGSLANTAVISIAAGATYDVSAVSSYSLSSANTLTASGKGTSAGTAAVINGATVNLSSRPVILNFTPTAFSGDAAHPSLTIPQGFLTLNNNTITVTNLGGSPLGAGVYQLIQVGNGANGSISGTPRAAVTVFGGGVVAGNTAYSSLGNGNVNLVVAPTASFSSLTPSQTIGVGTPSITLSGKVSAAGPIYPTAGETVSVTINGNTQNTTITDATGDFTINYNTSTTPGSGTPYPITYSYGGDIALSIATDASTSLTVSTIVTPVITGIMTSGANVIVNFMGSSSDAAWPRSLWWVRPR